jgi:large subunit ribosomal protein L23
MTTNLPSVLIHPHITEKATFSAENSVYVFKVQSNATKTSVEQAFKEKYKVNPIKVRTVTIPAKNVFVRGKKGIKSGYKKAYIYLKKGEKIEII